MRALCMQLKCAGRPQVAMQQYCLSLFKVILIKYYYGLDHMGHNV